MIGVDGGMRAAACPARAGAQPFTGRSDRSPAIWYRLRLLARFLDSIWREHMPRTICATVAAGLLLSAAPAFAQAKARATTPEIPFDAISFVREMPAGLYMGEAIGVATNSKGHVFVMT